MVLPFLSRVVERPPTTSCASTVTLHLHAIEKIWRRDMEEQFYQAWQAPCCTRSNNQYDFPQGEHNNLDRNCSHFHRDTRKERICLWWLPQICQPRSWEVIEAMFRVCRVLVSQRRMFVFCYPKLAPGCLTDSQNCVTLQVKGMTGNVSIDTYARDTIDLCLQTMYKFFNAMKS